MDVVMDKETLRVVIAIAGAVLILVIFIWDRLNRRKSEQEENAWEERMNHISLNPGAEADEVVAVEPLYAESESNQHTDVDEEAPMVDLSAMGDELDAVALEPEIHPRAEVELEAAKPAQPVPEVEEEILPEPVATSALPALIQLFVVARNGEQFEGVAMAKAFTELGLDFGEMGIFHRYAHTSDDRLFSVASMVEPGTFPIDQMEAFSSPGLALFFEPPHTPDPLEAFDLLIHTCRELADRFGGEMWDRRRTSLSEEAIETLRRSLV
jgi:cell division protein ZipA